MSSTQVSGYQSFKMLKPRRAKTIQLNWYFRHRQEINLLRTRPKSKKEESEWLVKDICHVSMPPDTSGYLQIVFTKEKERTPHSQS